MINDLKDKGQPLKIFRTADKNSATGVLSFYVSINLENIAFFEHTSYDKWGAEEVALSKAMRFLKNLSHLVKNFQFCK